MVNTDTLPALWAKCINRLKDKVNNRSFWEAIEKTQPIAVEQDTLIIGLDFSNFNQATHIQQTSVQHTIQATIAEMFGRPLKLRLIEGATLADWEALKQRDERIAAMQHSVSARREVDATQTANWDTLGEYIFRMFAPTPYRSLPQGKARYANEALYTLVEAMDTLYTEPPDETMERSLARILERMSNACEIPAPVLAFELERLRAWRKASMEANAAEMEAA